MSFWKYLSLFCCCIGACYIESCIFIKQIFLGRALTSICHFFCLPVCPSICRAPYLRNCASSNHDFWYTCVKWWYFQGLSLSFFRKFHFFIFPISGTVPHISVIFGTRVKLWYLLQFLFCCCWFFQNSDCLGFSKFINKYEVCPSLLTCVWFFLHFSFFKKKEFIWNAIKYFEVMKIFLTN